MSESPDREALEAVLAELVGEILGVLERRGQGRVIDPVSPQTLRDILAREFDFRNPVPLGPLRERVSDLLRRWTVDVTHPAYFGLFNPPVDPAGIVADTLAALYNPQLAAWSHAPAANEIERHTLDYFAEAIWPAAGTGAGAFTSGGAEANLSALIVALTDRFPAFGELGLRALPGAPRLYASGESHHSLVKAAHFTGIGRESLRLVPVDAEMRMDCTELEAMIEADRADGGLPFLVVGTAGTTASGAIDPLRRLAETCSRLGLWFHVDAAWGGTACLSPVLAPALSGIELADSVTWDAHKWLSVPMGAGMFFCRRTEARAAAFRTRAAYMPADTSGAIDPYVSTIQWSRRFTGLKLFMTLAALGRDGLVARIERQARMGERLRDSLRRDGWEIVNSTPFPVVCFRRPGIDDGTAIDQLLEHLYDRGEVWISRVALPGIGNALRACITSYETGPREIRLLSAELRQAVEAVAPDGSPAGRLRGEQHE